jgi:hypothetical protein
MAEELQYNALLACSNGAHCPHTNTASHSWVFASKVRHTLTEGAGPDNSLPELMSSYWSELGGLLAVLYIIYRICHYYQIQEGKVTLYCDNKGASSTISKPSPRVSHRISLVTITSYNCPETSLK